MYCVHKETLFRDLSEILYRKYLPKLVIKSVRYSIIFFINIC